MLVKCKITKFWEVNYKILTQILATLVVIAAVHKNLVIAKCLWCQERANIDHILVHCVYTKYVRRSIIGALGEVSKESWILGGGLAPLMIRSYGFPILLSIRPISRHAMAYFRSPYIYLNRKLSALHLFFMMLTDMFKICLYCRMNEYTTQPLHLKILQRLLDDVTPNGVNTTYQLHFWSMLIH